MAIQFALLISAAYLLGSVPAAYLAAKWSQGIDIRQYGSGNVGASNLLKFTSKKVAIPVIIFDLGKGMLMVWAAQLVGLGFAQQVIVGLAVIVGHNWPAFLRFSGGRGGLTSLGVAVILVPKLGLILASFAFLLSASQHLALGTILAIALLPICSWFSSAPVIRWLFGQPLSTNEQLPVTLGFLAIFLVAVIRRLIAPRTSLTTSVPMGELIVNRLLFDRDIRDREAWIHRTPTEANSAELLLEQQKSKGRLNSK
ncbi:glycerol-3-phosphate acyltransferase [Chloroflexota bacterium]